MLENDTLQIMTTIIRIVKSVLKKIHFNFGNLPQKEAVSSLDRCAFSIGTCFVSFSEMATIKYKCFILERALVERLKSILRKLLSLKSFWAWSVSTYLLFRS